jgi:hypothetical protein
MADKILLYSFRAIHGNPHHESSSISYDVDTPSLGKNGALHVSNCLRLGNPQLLVRLDQALAGRLRHQTSSRKGQDHAQRHPMSTEKQIMESRIGAALHVSSQKSGSNRLPESLHEITNAQHLRRPFPSVLDTHMRATTLSTMAPRRYPSAHLRDQTQFRTPSPYAKTTGVLGIIPPFAKCGNTAGVIGILFVSFRATTLFSLKLANLARLECNYNKTVGWGWSK